jgi:hypothetical protein
MITHATADLIGSSVIQFGFQLDSLVYTYIFDHMNRGADKSLARPTSRCILFDGENISFDASLVI